MSISLCGRWEITGGESQTYMVSNHRRQDLAENCGKERATDPLFQLSYATTFPATFRQKGHLRWHGRVLKGLSMESMWGQGRNDISTAAGEANSLHMETVSRWGCWGTVAEGSLSSLQHCSQKIPFWFLIFLKDPYPNPPFEESRWSQCLIACVSCRWEPYRKQVKRQHTREFRPELLGSQTTLVQSWFPLSHCHYHFSPKRLLANTLLARSVGRSGAVRTVASLGKVIELTQGEAAPLWLSCTQTPAWRDVLILGAGPWLSRWIFIVGNHRRRDLPASSVLEILEGELAGGDWGFAFLPSPSPSLSFSESWAQGWHPLCGSMSTFSSCDLQLWWGGHHLERRLRPHLLQAEHSQPLWWCRRRKR